ncbi:MAG: ribose-phosphate diphosphokinase, partial [Roseiflexaceae bacterium]|nr:ribose-phosphate diphosphokinase [Roseiflexaceae bacterium]
YFRERGWNNVTVVSSDIGFAKRARNFAEMLGAPLAIVEKRHPARADAESENGIAAISLIGDVAGRRCILVDDEVNTGRSLVSAAELLERHGAREVYAAVAHPVLGGDGAERLRASPIRELVTTDTLPVPAEKAWPGLRTLTVAPMLAEVIQRIHSGVSVHTIFPPRALAR